MALKSTGTEWDYDLIGTSFFIVAAEVDLILKAKEISRLGDSTFDYPGLLPALLCAEDVVEVGMGFCLFTITTPLLVPHLLEHRFSAFRTAWVATIPLVFGIVASFFTFYAHKAIFETAPVIWWSSRRVARMLADVRLHVQAHSFACGEFNMEFRQGDDGK
ncbi:hypothetical protein B0H11DRAFT_1943690 [Mycena galericulata]|nr:hypothetical protein B0H11DRAFT_1943690 [Mycena galericulata]